jgi:hypothetical protein
LDYGWTSICWSPKLLLFAIVSGAAIQTSSNGKTWSTKLGPNSTLYWKTVCWSEEKGLFVALSYADSTSTGYNIITSSDGITWTPSNKTSLIFGGSYSRWSCVIWAKEFVYLGITGCFIAVTDWGGTKIARSSDGINWASITLTGDISASGWVSMCWSPKLGLLVAVASSGTNSIIQIMTSPNGDIWTAQIQPTGSNYWTSVCWSQELSIFVAVGSSGSNQVMTSSNGSLWEAQNTGFTTQTWNSVCWGKDLGLFVAVAKTGVGQIMTSSNGKNWSLRTEPNDNTWTSICFSPELSLFASVANSGGTAKIMYFP